MTEAIAGLRRRLRDLSASSALDEALALCRAEPRWLAMGLLGPLAFSVVLIVGVALHRAAWGAVPMDELLPLRTLPLAAFGAVAWVGRGIGHGLVARALAASLGHQSPRARPLSLALGQAVASGATLLGLPLILPGLASAGRFAILPGLLGVEGQSLGTAVRVALRAPSASGRRGAWAALLTAALWLVVSLNLALAAVGGVGLLRLLTGLDTAGLTRIVDLTNPGVLVAIGAVAFVLVDPVWAVVRAVLFVERVEGASGAGLERRWGELLARPSAMVFLLALGGLLASPPAQAASGQTVEGWATAAHDGARELHAIADGWDGAETVLVGPLEEVLREELGGLLRRSDGGTVPIDAGPLLDGLPAVARSSADIDRVRAVARALEDAAREARRSSEGQLAGPPPADLLAAELAEHPYRLSEAHADAGPARESGLRERIRAWWEGLFTEEVAPEQPPLPATAAPGPAGRLVVGAVAVAALGLVVLVLVFAARAFAEAAPVDAAVPPLAATRVGRPDPRERAAAAWLAEAERMAERGEHGPAVRSLYLAVLSHMDARGAIQARPERTNGEMVDGFRGASAWRRLFRDVVTGYERVHFGGREAAGDWEGLRRSASPLLPGGRFEETP